VLIRINGNRERRCGSTVEVRSTAASSLAVPVRIVEAPSLCKDRTHVAAACEIA
jgi:hypothetical protein